MTPPPPPVSGSPRPRRTPLDVIGINTPLAFLFPALLMVLYACLADPAGTDPGGNMTPETGSFTIIRGPDGAVTIRPAHPLADGDDDDDDEGARYGARYSDRDHVHLDWN